MGKGGEKGTESDDDSDGEQSYTHQTAENQYHQLSDNKEFTATFDNRSGHSGNVRMNIVALIFSTLTVIC